MKGALVCASLRPPASTASRARLHALHLADDLQEVRHHGRTSFASRSAWPDLVLPSSVQQDIDAREHENELTALTAAMNRVCEELSLRAAGSQAGDAL